MYWITQAFQVIKYSLIGGFVWFVCFALSWDGMVFLVRSEAVELEVIAVHIRETDDDSREYRSAFALAGQSGLRLEYTDKVWRSQNTHIVGDVVHGRFRADTGEMHSGESLAVPVMIGIFGHGIGMIMAFQVFLLLIGTPERELLLRIRGRSRSLPLDLRDV